MTFHLLDALFAVLLGLARMTLAGHVIKYFKYHLLGTFPDAGEREKEKDACTYQLIDGSTSIP